MDSRIDSSETQGPERGWRARWGAWLPWVACGVFFGAGLAAPLRTAVWLLPAVLAAAAVGAIAGLAGWRGGLRRLAMAAAAVLITFVVLWGAIMSGDTRLAPAEFQTKDLRVHSLLADVPLHDVWAFRLRGGTDGMTLSEAREVMSEASPYDMNTIVVVLVGTRFLLGDLFGWDDEKYFDLDASYVNRLTEADRARTQVEPGSGSEMFRVLYAFENEATAEMMNHTAHAFFCMALEPAGDGYTMYWAIYLRETSGLTPVYMALIDPFRRYIVYPAMARRVESAWAERFAGD
jgi:hypothetical protein